MNRHFLPLRLGGFARNVLAVVLPVSLLMKQQK
jgi:hypothetical protein